MIKYSDLPTLDLNLIIENLKRIGKNLYPGRKNLNPMTRG